MKKYANYYNRWCVWASQFPEVSVLPAYDIHVALYLVSLLQQGSSSHVAEAVVYGVRWAHQTKGYSDPIGVLSRRVVEAARRLAKPRRKPKEPLSPQILRAILAKTDTYSLLDYRRFTLILVSFLRFDGAVGLRRWDVSFVDTYMTLFIEHSKTDQYRDGHTLVIARTGTSVCPVSNLERYFAMMPQLSDDSFIFRALVRSNTPYKYSIGHSNRPLSYSTCRLDLIEVLYRAGIDSSAYGLHSARSGGATWAANAGVPDRLFKRHGRWASDRAKDSYVKDNTFSGYI